MISQNNTYFWDNAYQSGTIWYGNKFQNIIPADCIEDPILFNGQSKGMFDNAATFRYTSPFAPYVRTAERAVDRTTLVPTTRVEHPSMLAIASKKLPEFAILASHTNSYVSSLQLGPHPNTSWDYSIWRGGASAASHGDNGSTCTAAFKNSVPILGGIKREQIIMYPVFNVMNTSGQSTTISYRTWLAGTYPDYSYCTGISVSFYFKANIDSNSAVAFNNLKIVTVDNVDNVGGYNGFYTGYVGYNRLEQMYIFYPLAYQYSNGQYLVSPNVFCLGTHDPAMLSYLSVNNRYYPYISMDTARKIVNAVGLQWIDHSSATADVHGNNTTSSEVHMPFVTSDGQTSTADVSGSNIGALMTGGQIDTTQNYYNPENVTITNNTSNNSTTDFIGNTNIDPNAPPDPPSDEYDQTEISPGGTTDERLLPSDDILSPFGLFAAYYVLTRDDIFNLCDQFWASTVVEGIIQTAALFVNMSPLEMIISLMMYPFNVQNLLNSSTTRKTVRFGGFDIGQVVGYWLEPTNVKFNFSLGSCYIKGRYNNFLDLAPYTTLTLYVPYVGFISLDMATFAYEILSLEMSVDLSTGTCRVYYFKGESDTRIPIGFADGVIGHQIMITSGQSDSRISAMMNLISDIQSATVSLIEAATDTQSYKKAATNFKTAKLATKYGSGSSAHEVLNTKVPHLDAISKAAVAGVSAVKLFSTGPDITKTGTNTPMISMTGAQVAYVLISRPTLDIPANYNHTYGRVCHIDTYINACTGFTVCENVDVSGLTCSETEKSMIKEILEGGFYA